MRSDQQKTISTIKLDEVLHRITGTTHHDDHERHHDHDHDHGEESMGFVWKMFLLLVAIYVFYLVESLFSILFRGGAEVEPTHGHSHNLVPKLSTSNESMEIIFGNKKNSLLKC